MQSGGKTIELAVMEMGKPLEVGSCVFACAHVCNPGFTMNQFNFLMVQFLEPDQIEVIMKRIEKIKEEEAKKKKGRREVTAAAAPSSRPQFASVSD